MPQVTIAVRSGDVTSPWGLLTSWNPIQGILRPERTFRGHPSSYKCRPGEFVWRPQGFKKWGLRIMKTIVQSNLTPRISRIASIAISVAAGVAFSGALRSLPAQESSQARAVVTVTSKAAEETAPVPRQSITLLENRKMQEVTGWAPLRGERSGLQLVVLLDDSSRGSLGTQLNDLKSFVTALPPSAQVAIGYMRNGTPNLTQGFTNDHAEAAKSFRLPVGTTGINGSPYFCLSDLVKHWPGSDNVRREVIMVTDGTDRYTGGPYDPDNPYVQAALSDAQRAGVIVYSIYYRGAGRLDNSQQVTDGGQNYLTQVSESTGGQVYLEGFGNPVSFAPFLSDIQRKLRNQYELTFVSTAKPGLQAIQVKTSQPNTKLKWPSRVQVGGVTAPQ
jgi:DNA-binding PadR family transcriptional regulator